MAIRLLWRGNKKRWSACLCPMLLVLQLHAQDSIRYRVIFIGDAGQIDAQQTSVLTHASENILPGKTSVVFLGDNIYPHGFGVPGSGREEQRGAQILQSQYGPMRSKTVPVYFIPGNHDWGGPGKRGLARIRQQSAYLEQQQDSFLRPTPAHGCPDPVEINVADSLVIIAFDSEWWLFPYDKSDPSSACGCHTTQDVTRKMAEIFSRSRDKIILLASHHPFQSYGHHGGYFSIKDHLFPLTSLHPALYLPLPVIGSLYPFLRTKIKNREDLGHSCYRGMIRQVDSVFQNFPGLIHVAGHEHGLQLIKTAQVQVVSGAGAKNAYVKKGKRALFTKNRDGYVTIDLLSGRNVRITYYALTGSRVHGVFSYPLSPTAPGSEMGRPSCCKR